MKSVWMWPWPRKNTQADLYEWSGTLDAIDASLRHYVEAHPQLLLLPPSAEDASRPSGAGNEGRDGMEAEGADGNDGDAGKADAKSDGTGKEAFWSHRPDALEHHSSTPAPPSVESNILTLLSFLSSLLRQATNKPVFNSLPLLSDLLASSSDSISAAAVGVLADLAMPAAMVRQQGPEVPCHAPTMLHAESAGSTLMGRLMVCAKGYGTKGCGLGLMDVVGMDDALPGGDPYGILGGNGSEEIEGGGKPEAAGGAGKSEGSAMDTEDGNAAGDDDGGSKSDDGKSSPKRPLIDHRTSPAGRVDFACHGRPDDGLSRVVNTDQSDGVLLRLGMGYDDMLLDGPG